MKQQRTACPLAEPIIPYNQIMNFALMALSLATVPGTFMPRPPSPVEWKRRLAGLTGTGA